MNSAKKNADKGVFSHNEHDSLTFFSANILQANDVISDANLQSKCRLH